MTTIAGAPNCGTKSNNEDDDIVEITLDICDDDTIAFHVTSSHQEVATRLAKTMQNRSSSSTSLPKRTKPRSAYTPRGLRFVTDTKSDSSWLAVEKRFDDLTSRTDGLLHRNLFGECIGMDKQSEKFTVVLVDALRRRRHVSESSKFINKAELREYLDQISDQSFDSRLQTFFDMVDKDGDGRITEEEVKEIISVSASANKLTKVESYSEEYAALIMEEFDPDNFGYIMIHDLEMLLVEASNDGSSIRSGRENISSRSCSSEMLNPSGEEAGGNYYWWRSSYKRYLRLITLRSSIKPVKILKVGMYPGNVLALYMTKPLDFKYKSGQYMFINCSDVSRFEWRPFYITSAPGDAYLSVHIQILGDWTRQLYTVFSRVCRPPMEADLMGGRNPSFPRVSIDGPYEASTQDYKKHEVVLLVGIGIDIAPMISVVKDIVNNIRAMEGEVDEAFEGSSTRSNPTESNSKKKGFKTKRAYFYWVTEEQGSFEWFKGVMDEVAEMDQKDVIELHNYCTSVHEEGDARSVFISLVQRLNHAKNCVDIVSGTRVMSHFAKPNWHDVYQRIALNHETSHVGVFCCGPQTLAKELGQLALDFSGKTSTKFDFHRNHF